MARRFPVAREAIGRHGSDCPSSSARVLRLLAERLAWNASRLSRLRQSRPVLPLLYDTTAGHLLAEGPIWARSKRESGRTYEAKSAPRIEHMRWLNELPLGFRLYFWIWTLFVPAGAALVLAGAVVPGLVLLVLFVLDQAIFVPLMVARSQRQKRAGSDDRR